MKKVYEKPMILFEDFTISANVAGNCTLITTTQSEGKFGCGYEVGNWTIGPDGMPVYVSGIVFTSEVYGCNIEEVDGDYNGICYHGPSDLKNLFAS